MTIRVEFPIKAVAGSTVLNKTRAVWLASDSHRIRRRRSTNRDYHRLDTGSTRRLHQSGERAGQVVQGCALGQRDRQLWSALFIL